jgi:RNA polymerase sigma-70 factor (ECF subfamily)
MEIRDPEASVDGLVRRVREGEVELYAEIVRRYQGDVWKVVCALLRDLKASEDLVQQAFVQAFQYLDRFRPGEDFGAWVRQIARNLVRQELRTRARESRRLEAYSAILEERLRDDREADRRRERVAEALRACREGLPERGAEALAMRYERAMGFEEIAGSMGRTVEATRQLLVRVRSMLRGCIERRLAES